MEINIQKLIDGIQKSIPIDNIISKDEIEKISEEYQFNNIIIKGDISNKNEEIILSFNIKTTLLVTCSRCACDFEMPICLDITRHFSNEKDGEEDYAMEKNQIDISSIVNEEVFLYLPVVKLCSQDCKGICPKCGMNLNDKTCQCETQPLRGEFEKLKKLF